MKGGARGRQSSKKGERGCKENGGNAQFSCVLQEDDVVCYGYVDGMCSMNDVWYIEVDTERRSVNKYNILLFDH